MKLNTAFLCTLVCSSVLAIPAAEAKQPPPLTGPEVLKALEGSWTGNGIVNDIKEHWEITTSGNIATLVSTGLAINYDESYRRNGLFRYRQTLTATIETDPKKAAKPQFSILFTETKIEVIEVLEGEQSPVWMPMTCNMVLAADLPHTYVPVLDGGCETHDDENPILFRLVWKGRKDWKPVQPTEGPLPQAKL